MSSVEKKINFKPVEKLYDAIGERMVVTGLLLYGSEVFYDADSLLREHDFYHIENRIVYSAFKELITQQNIDKPDVSNLIGLISKHDKESIGKYSLNEYLDTISKEKLSKENVKPHITSVAKFALARNLKSKLMSAVYNLDQMTGTESVLSLINEAEKPVSDFTSSLIGKTDIVKLSDKMGAFLEYLAKEQPATAGISTGFPLYDKVIGGGLRVGVHMLGARSGGAKSFLCLNVAYNCVKKNIPILYLDTELTEDMVLGRWAGLITSVPIDQIESGQFANNKLASQKVYMATKNIDKLPFYYYNISGMSHEEWISIMRRWIMRHVGFHPDGKAKPCLIVLDYIKLMSLEMTQNVKEYQILGQIITDLHNFCVRYNVPIFTAVQLNRDGINREDQGVIAGSDRLVHLCSSFAIMKNKGAEDYADDPMVNGQKKIITVKARFGPGTGPGEYINVKTSLERSLLEEGDTNINNRRNASNPNRLVDNDNNGTEQEEVDLTI